MASLRRACVAHTIPVLLLLWAPVSAGFAEPDTQAPAARSQDEAMGQSYREGGIFPGGERVALDDAGHVLSVQAGTGRMADFGDAPLFVVLVTIEGPLARWAFDFGAEASALTLVVDGQRYASVEAQFAAQVVVPLAPVAPGTKPERSRHRSGGVTSVVDTTEHPLAVIFRLPSKVLNSPGKTLSLRGFELDGRAYSLDLRFAE